MNYKLFFFIRYTLYIYKKSFATKEAVCHFSCGSQTRILAAPL